MTRPRLSRHAMGALYATALAENTALRQSEALRRINEIGALARLAFEIHQSSSPDNHPRLGELMRRRDALRRTQRLKIDTQQLEVQRHGENCRLGGASIARPWRRGVDTRR